MRIYYAMEAEGLRHHVRSALGVDARAWNRLNRRVREWRQQLESRYGIPADLGLRPERSRFRPAVLRLRLPPATGVPARELR